MDQDHFRSLLQSTSTSTSKPPSSKFGKPPPKPSVTSTGKTTDFKPRPSSTSSKNNKSKSNNNKSGTDPSGSSSGYRDRAAERRAGKESDFANAEKLLKEFEARQQNDRDSQTTDLEEQRKYLGGDAEHSILVKGLDIALLERNKAELLKKQQEGSEDVETLLDRQLEEPSTLVDSSSSSKGKGKSIEKGTKKKSRDELLKELKASRQTTNDDISTSTTRGLGKGWKKLGATTTTIDAPPTQGEKKLRRKKKKLPPTDPSSSSSAAATAMTTTSQQPPPPPPLSPPRAATHSTTTELEPGAEVNEFGSDDDIFNDAGSYKGFDSSSSSSSSEEDEGTESKKKGEVTKSKSKSKSKVPPPVSAVESVGGGGGGGGKGKRKYFDDDDEEGEAGNTTTTAPSSLTDLASRQQSHLLSTSTTSQNAAPPLPRSGYGEQGEEEEEEEVSSMTKLQPLSGSRGPSVKELLEMDKAAEEEEKRKAKKLKRQQKSVEGGSETGKDLSQADKANRDYLQMEAYLAKKKLKE